MTINYRLDDTTLTATYRDHLLFRYVYQPDMPREHAPRPFFHPINALNGELLTDAQPADHAWHYGLSYAIPYVNGVNFWGGGTYVHGQGYVNRVDHGRVEHVGWESEWVEHLHWRCIENEVWIAETRSITAEVIDDTLWSLELGFSLHNLLPEPIEFSSPALKGRAGAGYGGLFWRGTPTMRDWIARTDGMEGETAVHGSESAWFMLDDPHTGTRIVLRDHPTNPYYPTRWFLRQQEYPGVCIPLAYAAPFLLGSRETLNLTYSIVITAPTGDPL